MAVHLVLQLGYFKAKRQFFVYALEAVTEDAGAHPSALFPGESIWPKSSRPPNRLGWSSSRVILKLFDYRPCDAAAKAELEQKAQRVAMLSTQPVFILREVLQYLAHQRIVAPATPICRTWLGGPSPANACASPGCSVGR